MSSKKLKKGIIHSKGREIVNNVHHFMQKEAEEGITIPLKNYRERTLAATGVSEWTLKKISKEARKIDYEGPSTSFQSPKKRKEVKIKKRKIDLILPQHIKSIREIVHDFYILEKRLPTIKCIFQKIMDRQIIPDAFSVSTLRRLLIQIGFRWQKMPDTRRKVLCESYDIRLKRIKFLKKMIEYRNEGRNIIYTDETYIHSSHVQDKGCYDEELKGLKKPKGQRFIIVHAGGEKGFVKNGLLIFKSGAKTGDYHNDMNNENFMKWVNDQLLPNMPEKSVLVVNNASYHNVPIKKNVTTASKKEEMLEWLAERGLPTDPKLTKPEIYQSIQQYKFRFPIQYKLDELLNRHGHEVLRLPPYHPELNPIEKIWALVKNWVAARNVTFKLADTEALTREKFDQVSEQEWYSICQYVKRYEEELIQREHILDKTLDHLKFTVNTGSSSEESEDSEGENTASEDELGCLPLSSDND